MRIDIWSDVVCPFCYLGKRRLERALASFEHANEVEIYRHSFELLRSAPRVPDQSMVEHLVQQHGVTVRQAEDNLAHLTSQAAAEGLTFGITRAPYKTFDAHRLIHLAARSGLDGALEERFFAAFFTEGTANSDREVLRSLAGDVGLDDETVRQVLDGQKFSSEVEADKKNAQKLGITSVPFFVFDQRFAISGAQSTETFAAALTPACGTEGDAPPSSATPAALPLEMAVI